MKPKLLQPSAFSLQPCFVWPGNFCNRSGQLLPAVFGEKDFIPAKAALLTDGTTTAQQSPA
jgi:hypothetical protein